MKVKEYLSFMLFKLFIIIISPYLFITGGFARIIRFYKYVIAKEANKEVDTYNY